MSIIEKRKSIWTCMVLEQTNNYSLGHPANFCRRYLNGKCLNKDLTNCDAIKYTIVNKKARRKK